MRQVVTQQKRVKPIYSRVSRFLYIKLQTFFRQLLLDFLSALVFSSLNSVTFDKLELRSRVRIQTEPLILEKKSPIKDSLCLSFICKQLKLTGPDNIILLKVA